MEHKCATFGRRYGTRLCPFNQQPQNAWLQLAGSQLLKIGLKHWKKYQHTKINTHYLADKVVEHIDQLNNRNMKIELVHEPELLGTAGTLLANRDLFSNSTGLLTHADNAMKGSLNEFIDAHNKRPDDCINYAYI